MKTVFKYFLLIVFVIIQFEGIKLNAQQCVDPNSLLKYKNSRIGPNEYVIFIFKRPTSFTYSVNTCTPPFISAQSGEPVTVAGDKFKKINFSNVVWMCQSVNNISLYSGGKVKGVSCIEQFEGEISYVVGYRSNVTYRGTYYYNSGNKKYVVMKFR
jgi:hypothetical protein